MNRPRVLLADDHRMVSEALKNLLSPEFDVVGIVEDGVALVEAAASLAPDVIVADISMPRLDGLQALSELKKQNPLVKVVFLSMHQGAGFMRGVVSAGACGYVSKYSAPSELIAAIHAALAGKIYLAAGPEAEILPEAQGDLSGDVRSRLSSNGKRKS